MNRDIVISTPARRYARALLEVTIKQRNFTLVLEELETIQKQFQQFPSLKQLFLTPALPQENKRRILESLAKRLELQTLTVNFLKTIIRHDRLNLLEEVIVSMEQQFLERQGIVVVEVLTARRLDRQEENEIISTLETFTGKKVQLENHVNPALIGGAITRIGSTLYDGSVQAQLDQLKTRIIES